MKKIFSFVACIFCILAQANSDLKLGFRDEATFFDENKVNVANIDYSAEPAGASKKFDRAFENSPPLIPHDIEDLIPITKDNNMCISCHMPEFAKDSGATAIPKSHLMDLRTNKSNNGRLDASRFNCTQCHVPQANANPLVLNKFKPEFRDKKLKSSSNLLEKLNEGVK